MSADNTMNQTLYPLGIDIGSTTVKIAVLSPQHKLLFSDYERHFADIQNTLAKLLDKAYQALGEIQVAPVITGSGGLTLANHLEVPFVQEVIAVSTSLQELAPKTDVAIELGGEDAKIIYFEGGNVEQRMNGICEVPLSTRWRLFYRQTLQALTNTQSIIKPFILLPRDAVFSQKQISSP